MIRLGRARHFQAGRATACGRPANPGALLLTADAARVDCRQCLRSAVLRDPISQYYSSKRQAGQPPPVPR